MAEIKYKRHERNKLKYIRGIDNPKTKDSRVYKFVKAKMDQHLPDDLSWSLYHEMFGSKRGGYEVHVYPTGKGKEWDTYWHIIHFKEEWLTRFQNLSAKMDQNVEIFNLINEEIDSVTRAQERQEHDAYMRRINGNEIKEERMAVANLGVF